MSYTKATLRTAVLRKADALVGSTTSPFFDVTAGGEVDRTIGLVFDREWRRILNSNRYYRIQKVSPTSDSTGRVTKASLSTGTGDTLKRFYRVINASKTNLPYTEMELADLPLAEALGAAPFVWYEEGTSLMFLPKEANVVFDFWVNFMPQRPDKLSGEGIAVDFPEEFEELLVVESAAWLLAKGGNETKAASELRAGAEDIRTDMLQDIARISTNPTQVRFPDHPYTWGG